VIFKLAYIVHSNYRVLCTFLRFDKYEYEWINGKRSCLFCTRFHNQTINHLIFLAHDTHCKTFNTQAVEWQALSTVVHPEIPRWRAAISEHWQNASSSNSPLLPSMYHVDACAAAKLVVCSAYVASWQDAKMTQYYRGCVALEFMLGNSITKLPARCMLAAG